MIEDVLTEFKRTHLEHIEDIVITDGYEGGKAVVEYFRGLLLTLKGTSSEAVKVSVKWFGGYCGCCWLSCAAFQNWFGPWFLYAFSVWVRRPVSWRWQ